MTIFLVGMLLTIFCIIWSSVSEETAEDKADFYRQ